MKIFRYIAICGVVLLAMVGCFKEESYDTTLFFIPAQQTESGADFVDLEGCVVYAYVADTTLYTPLNYDDAVRGVLTNKETGATLQPSATSVESRRFYSYTYEIEEDDDDDEDDEDDDDDEETIYPYEDGELVVVLLEGVELSVSTEEVMLLAVDTLNEAYAYSNYTVGVNLDLVYLTLSFRPWKEGEFTQGKWQFVNPELPEEEIEEEEIEEEEEDADETLTEEEEEDEEE